MPRLSEMPDFLPAGEPGSPERRACALGTFSDRRANSIVMTALLRSAAQRQLARLATHPVPASPTAEHHTPGGAARLEKAQANV